MTPLPVSEELVERLRRNGADKDLIEFTERLVARYSQADLDRAVTRFFWAGVGIGTIVGGVVLAFLR